MIATCQYPRWIGWIVPRVAIAIIDLDLTLVADISRDAFAVVARFVGLEI